MILDATAFVHWNSRAKVAPFAGLFYSFMKKSIQKSGYSNKIKQTCDESVGKTQVLECFF